MTDHLSRRDFELIVDNLLAALKCLWAAVDAGIAADPAIWLNAAIKTKEAISSAEGADIRAQSFAERERDLLLANNAIEERARVAERRVRFLEEREREMTESFVSQFIRMSRRRMRWRDALRAVTSIAEEKLADMVIFDAAAQVHGRDYDAVRTAKYAADISDAKRLLGEA